MNELPADYVDLGWVAMQIVELRKHTTDIHRFQKYLGLALELDTHEPNTEEYLAVVEKAGDREALGLTCIELSEVWLEASFQLDASL